MTNNKVQKILVLGASGMLGNSMLRLFSQCEGYEVIGSCRSATVLRYLPTELHDQVICGIDVENIDSLTGLFAQAKPDVVINCIGLVKQLAEASDPLAALPINSLLPHRLARLCQVAASRLIHISTDCVFAGNKGNYVESDMPDALDLYGRSKLMGEVVAATHAITLRTSIIGHELASAHGLVGWFLAQSGAVNGYRRAVFSGFPTVELAHIIHDYVVPNPNLHGLYQVSAAPIDKFALLKLLAAQYGRTTVIVPDDKIVIDRSLDSTRFRKATGYTPPDWPELVRRMHAFG